MTSDCCGARLCFEVWGRWVGVGGRLFLVCGHILGLRWPVVGAMLVGRGLRSRVRRDLGTSSGPWEYVGPSGGLSWPMLTQLKPQDPKNGKTFEAFAIGGSVAQVASVACGVWVVRWCVWVWGG